MKTTTLVILCTLALNGNLIAQFRNFDSIPKEVIDKFPGMGEDNSSVINEFEGQYLNLIFKDSIGDFNFTGKKVAFFEGRKLSSKKKYFDDERKRFIEHSTITNNHLYIFNDCEKSESGGYDAVIVSWSKIEMRKIDLIKTLKNRLTQSYPVMYTNFLYKYKTTKNLQ